MILFSLGVLVAVFTMAGGAAACRVCVEYVSITGEKLPTSSLQHKIEYTEGLFDSWHVLEDFNPSLPGSNPVCFPVERKTNSNNGYKDYKVTIKYFIEMRKWLEGQVTNKELFTDTFRVDGSDYAPLSGGRCPKETVVQPIYFRKCSQLCMKSRLDCFNLKSIWALGKALPSYEVCAIELGSLIVPFVAGMEWGVLPIVEHALIGSCGSVETKKTSDVNWFLDYIQKLIANPVISATCRIDASVVEIARENEIIDGVQTGKKVSLWKLNMGANSQDMDLIRTLMMFAALRKMAEKDGSQQQPERWDRPPGRNPGDPVSECQTRCATNYCLPTSPYCAASCAVPLSSQCVGCVSNCISTRSVECETNTNAC
jgi:hypothetical protein